MTDEELRKIAENATQGRWWVGDPQPFVPGADIRIYHESGRPIRISGSNARHVWVSPDGEFIAAFNPEMVLALLDRVEKAEQEAFDFVKQKAKEGAREKRELESRVRKAEQALARVRELHRRQPDTISGLDTGPAYCRCGEHYPCPTIKALEGDE